MFTLLLKNTLFPIENAEEAVVQIEGCEVKSPTFNGHCNDPISDKICDVNCRFGEGLINGCCKNEECMCVC